MNSEAFSPSFLYWVYFTDSWKISEEAGYNDGGVRYLICHTEDNCIQVSPSALREIMNNPDTVTPEDMEEIMDIPDRRSSYLFRLGLE